MFKVIHILILPIVVMSKKVSTAFPSTNPYAVKAVFGVVIVFSASYMAANPIHAIPHFIWDGVAYSIHGYGSLPIIYALRKYFIDIEF